MRLDVYMLSRREFINGEFSTDLDHRPPTHSHRRVTLLALLIIFIPVFDVKHLPRVHEVWLVHCCHCCWVSNDIVNRRTSGGGGMAVCVFSGGGGRLKDISLLQ